MSVGMGGVVVMVVVVFAWHMVGGMEGMGREECGGDIGGRRGWEDENMRMDRIFKDKEFVIVKVKVDYG